MKNSTLTERKLYEMLTESTGKHFLDSGSAYGRNWERNQKKSLKDFQNEPSTNLEFSVWESCDGNINSEFLVEHNIFHWLSERLEYNPNWQRRFTAFCNKQDIYPDMNSIKDFLDNLSDKGYNVSGLYGNGDPIVDNIYNNENLISQVFQYTFATIEGNNTFKETLIFLSIHAGFDVRGGYTDVKVFNPIDQYDETSIFDYARAGIGCTDCENSWYTDNGYTFSSNNGEIDLNDFDIVESTKEELEKEIKDHENEVEFLKKQLNIEGIKPNEPEYKQVIRVVDKVGYCPFCRAKLEAGYF